LSLIETERNTYNKTKNVTGSGRVDYLKNY